MRSGMSEISVAGWSATRTVGVQGWRSMQIRAAAVIVAAAIQVATVFYLANSVSGGDAYTYLALAEDWTSWSALTAPGAFESNFWPAGYPGFLALFLWAGDSQIHVVRLVQVALAAAVALMAGRIADSVSQRSGTITTVVVAFSPTAMWSVWAIGYELLLAFLLVAGVLLVWGSSRRSNSAWPLLGGLLMGLALLVQFRAVLAVLVLLVLVGRRAPRAASMALLGVVLPVAAWALRSFLAVGNPAPWSANGPYNLWNGNNPEATGHNVFPLPALPDGFSSYTEAALNWISANPVGFLVITGKKFLYLFEPTRIAGVSDPFPGDVIVSGVEYAIAGLVCVGLIAFVILRLLRVQVGLKAMDVPFLFSVAYLLPNIVFIVEARFAIPVHAILVAISVSSFLALYRFLREQRENEVSTPAG